MWKRILYHFSLSCVSSPTHVEIAHQRWLMIDLIHPFKAWHDFFFAAAVKFFLILLQKCQIWNWCLIFPHVFSGLWMSVVIWSTVTPFLKKKKIISFYKPYLLRIVIIFGFCNLGYGHSGNFISNLMHERVCQVFGIMSGIVTPFFSA